MATSKQRRTYVEVLYKMANGAAEALPGEPREMCNAARVLLHCLQAASWSTLVSLATLSEAFGPANICYFHANRPVWGTLWGQHAVVL